MRWPPSPRVLTFTVLVQSSGVVSRRFLNEYVRSAVETCRGVSVLDTNITHRVVNPGDARTSFARWLEAHGPRLHPNREQRDIVTNIFNNTITLNGGSLGSWVDEERS